MSGARRGSTEKPSAQITASEAIPELKISPPADYIVVPTTTLSLICGQGLVGEEQSLVPYLQTRFMKALNVDAGPADDMKVDEVFRATVSYENFAFLLMDMVRDFREETSQLAAFSSGKLKPEPVRLRYAIQCMTMARAAIEETLEELRTLTPPPPVDRPEARAPKAARKKPS